MRRHTAGHRPVPAGQMRSALLERLTDQDILLTFKEAEEFLRVSRATVYRLLWSGRLTGHKVGKGWRFYKADLHKLIAADTPRFQADSPGRSRR